MGGVLERSLKVIMWYKKAKAKANQPNNGQDVSWSRTCSFLTKIYEKMFCKLFNSKTFVHLVDALLNVFFYFESFVSLSFPLWSVLSGKIINSCLKCSEGAFTWK